MDKKQGYTLWEKWTGRAAPPPVPRPENSITNPLKLHCGDFVTAQMLEGNDRPFTVTEVREYVRRIGGEDFRFADYLVRQGDEVRILRANPKDGHTAAGLQDCDLLWLKIFYEMEFDQNVRGAVGQKVFEVDNDDDGTPDVSYDALNAGEDGYLARVQIARMGENQVTRRTLRYWDFYRKSDPKKNEMADEDIFFFVEIDESDGFTVMLEGPRISGNDIEVYPMDDKKQP